MKPSPLLLAGCLLLCLSGCQPAHEKEPFSTHDGSLLISHVRIARPSSNTLSQPQDILIADGKILRIVEPGTIPYDSVNAVLSGAGFFALPGLIDVHAHIGDGGIGPQSEADREGALAQWIRYGITTVFVPGGGGGNDDQLVAWKQRCRSGELLCPGLYGSGALITAPGSHPIGTIWDMPADVDAARVYARGAVAVAENQPVDTLLDRKIRLGMDALKIVIEDGPGPWYPKPRLSQTKIQEIVDASHARDLPVFAHVSRADHVIDGVAAGVDGVMHSSEDALTESTLTDMAEQRVFYVATLALYDGFFDQALRQFEQEPFALAGVSTRALTSLEDEVFRGQSADPPELVASLKATILSNLERAATAGVPLALGTDTNNPWVFPGYAVHEELALMVEAGLTPAQALDAATRGGAEFLRESESLGHIAPGFEADVLILRGNPLDNILHTRTLHAVIVDGELITEVVSSSGS